MQLTDDATVGSPVLEALEGNMCTFCEAGVLLRDSYKGNQAVICDSCHTPGAQVW